MGELVTWKEFDFNLHFWKFDEKYWCHTFVKFKATLLTADREDVVCSRGDSGRVCVGSL